MLSHGCMNKWMCISVAVYAVLCCAVLCCAVPCRAGPGCAVLCHAVLCQAVFGVKLQQCCLVADVYAQTYVYNARNDHADVADSTLAYLRRLHLPLGMLLV